MIKNRKKLEEFNIDLESLGITDRQLMVLSITGSKMFGTDTPDSDTDINGVYIPTKRQLILNDFKHNITRKLNKGSANKIDLQIWSIHHFMKDLYQGETMALDLLHSPSHCWLIYNEDLWQYLVLNKSFFYTSEMIAFVHYAREMASKYGVKGSRIESLKMVIDFLEKHPGKRLREIWRELPQGKHIHFLPPSKLDVNKYPMYQVNGMRYHETVKTEYVITNLNRKLIEYGRRAKRAYENEGIDWKAISHAIRAANQIHDILVDGTFTLPLRNAEYIREVKLGKHKFIDVQKVMEEKIEEVEKLIEKSKLRKEVDVNQWNDWMYNIIERKCLYEY